MKGTEFELPLKLQKKISKAIQSLNEAMKEVQETFPDANWYLEDSHNLNLLSTASHDEKGKSSFDSVIETWTLQDSSGGGW